MLKVCDNEDYGGHGNREKEYCVNYNNTGDTNVTNDIIPIDDWKIFRKLGENLYIVYKKKNKKYIFSPLYIHRYKFLSKIEKYIIENNPKELSIHEKMKFYRYKKNLVQDEVADIIGIQRSNYSMYEEGNRGYYPYDMANKLCELFEIDLNDLVDDYHIFSYNDPSSKVKQIRKELGNISQDELAKRINIDVQVISNCERRIHLIQRKFYDSLMNYRNEYFGLNED